MMDLDWRTIVKRELVMLPWRILDLTIMPGLLCDEKTVEQVKMKRRMQFYNYNQSLILTREEKEAEEDEDKNSKKISYHEQDNECENENNADDIIEIKEGDDVIHLQNDTDIKNMSNYDHTQTYNIKTHTSPTRRRKDNETSPNNTHIQRHSPYSNRYLTKSHPNDSDSSFNSPVARSRVAASSLHLRKFSRDHQLQEERSYYTSPNSTKAMKAKRTTTSNGRSGEKAIIKVPPLSAFQRNRLSPTKSPTKAKVDDSNYLHFDEDEGKRESLNHRLRNFITGDSNIRIRDYLFDVDLPSAPSRDSNISPSKTFESELLDNDDDEKEEEEDNNGSSSLSSPRLDELKRRKREYERQRELRREKIGSSPRLQQNKGTGHGKNSNSTRTRGAIKKTSESTLTVRRSSRLAAAK